MKLLGRFSVTKGYEHWKSVFDAHAPARAEAGITTVFTGVQADDPNIVHVCLEVDSFEGIQEFMQKPENAQVIQEAGVIVETQVMTPIIE